MVAEHLVVPDFNTYPTTHTLESASVIDGGVKVRWNDGLESRLPVLWLREYLAPAKHDYPYDYQ